MATLTKAQQEVLVKLGRRGWELTLMERNKSYGVITANHVFDQKVSKDVAESLVAARLLTEIEAYEGERYWKINAAGRAALEAQS